MNKKRLLRRKLLAPGPLTFSGSILPVKDASKWNVTSKDSPEHSVKNTPSSVGRSESGAKRTPSFGNPLRRTSVRNRDTGSREIKDDDATFTVLLVLFPDRFVPLSSA